MNYKFQKKKCVRLQPVNIDIHPNNSQNISKNEARIEFYSSNITRNLTHTLQLLIECCSTPCLTIEVKKRIQLEISSKSEQEYQKMKQDGKQQYSTVLFFKIKEILLNLPSELFTKYFTKVSEFYKQMLQSKQLSVSIFYAFVSKFVKQQLKNFLQTETNGQRQQKLLVIYEQFQCKQGKESRNSDLSIQLKLYNGMQIDSNHMEQMIDQWSYLDILESQFKRNESILRVLIKIQRQIQINKNERKYQKRTRFRNNFIDNEPGEEKKQKLDNVCEKKADTKKQQIRKAILLKSQSKSHNKYQPENTKHYNRERSIKIRNMPFQRNKILILSKKNRQKINV